MIAFLISTNTEIIGRKAILKPTLLSSVFASSPYIDDLKLDICTIVHHICVDHLFEDGNKRTAFAMLIWLAHLYKLPLKFNDSNETINLFENIAQNKFTSQEMIDKIFK